MTSRKEQNLSRKIATATLTTLTVAGLSAGVAQAAPAPALPPLPEIQMPTQQDYENFVLQQRDNLQGQADTLPDQLRQPAKDSIDNVTNFVAPGALASRAAAAAAESARRDAAAREEADRIRQQEANASAAARMAETANTPCPAFARACVDLDGHRSWLQDGNGNVVYGPVVSNSGGIGQETPRGTFTISRKIKDEISYEFNNAPMPYAVYFTNQGHAFHQGTTSTTSAGCVRLEADSARTFFAHLNPGDKVFIY